MSKIPACRFTPHGYLDVPHTTRFNNCGVVRSVPPLGMGFWHRALPWSYCLDMSLTINNYLSLMKVALAAGKVSIRDMAEAKAAGVCSRRHTSSVMSYNWEGDGLSFEIAYFVMDENTLCASWKMANASKEEQKFQLRVSNLFGYVDKNWWGSSGLVCQYYKEDRAWVDKIWEGGDIFMLGFDDDPAALGITAYGPDGDSSRWSGNLNGQEYATYELDKVPGLEPQADFEYSLGPGETRTGRLFLVRDRNEAYARRRLAKARECFDQVRQAKDAEDEKFYAGVPYLSGAWSDAWKQGWLQDFETLRMTIRPPMGIYTTPWDGMQIFSPRCVLGETHLDMMCYAYADSETAKQVILGCFKDAPAPNVPCSREDGSMNMIGAGGSECGTSPVWGLPFYVIRSIFYRDKDLDWLRELYPYLRSFIQWWMENRTDAEGYFHCDNSWESGQDGSKRFTFDGCTEADVVDFVRTVDVEAVMAHAMETMAVFARELNFKGDAEYWTGLAQDRIRRSREMFVQGWFRDFDGRTGKPIILKDYFDVMMILPITVGVALPEQTEEMKSSFWYFMENPKLMLEWPSFQFPFTEAASRAGLHDLVGKLLITTGDRVYGRETSRDVRTLAPRANASFPNCYRYKIPGQASEFWPLAPDPIWECGAEHYGWGATLPTMVIRNIFGIREAEDRSGFTVTPHAPQSWTMGETYGLRNCRMAGQVFDLDLTPVQGGCQVRIAFADGRVTERLLAPGESLDF